MRSFAFKNRKRPGSTSAGSTLVGVRLPTADLAALDKWISEQPKPMSRPMALRMMLAKVTETKRPT
jgi:hypothetical protein